MAARSACRDYINVDEHVVGVLYRSIPPTCVLFILLREHQPSGGNGPGGYLALAICSSYRVMQICIAASILASILQEGFPDLQTLLAKCQG
jgi:hypothetical protein